MLARVVASVTVLADYAQGRESRIDAAAERAEASQHLFERILRRAERARRRDFASALSEGLTMDELAEAVGLEPEDVLAILGNGRIEST
jgi:hypothetical protein